MSIVSKASIWLLAPTTCLLTLLEKQYDYPDPKTGQAVRAGSLMSEQGVSASKSSAKRFKE